jgi:hypothetical protein
VHLYQPVSPFELVNLPPSQRWVQLGRPRIIQTLEEKRSVFVDYLYRDVATGSICRFILRLTSVQDNLIHLVNAIVSLNLIIKSIPTIDILSNSRRIIWFTPAPYSIFPSLFAKVALMHLSSNWLTRHPAWRQIALLT